MNTNKSLEVNELLIYTIFFNDANILYNNPIYNALNISKDDYLGCVNNIKHIKLKNTKSMANEYMFIYESLCK